MKKDRDAEINSARRTKKSLRIEIRRHNLYQHEKNT